MKPASVLASVLLTVTVAVPASLPAAPWVELFNGRDLEGWVQRGGKATYAVEEGVIVGSSVLDTPNSFLCTPRTYGDFILEYEFKVDPRLNSGVQIRSECFEEPTEFVWEGKTIKIPAGRVHGYQVEIDPDAKRNRMWSAGIYDEARRAWLYPGILGGDGAQFSETGAGIFKQNDWNKVRVEAIGPSIKTWLNGKPRAAIVDDVTPHGLIALQVHGIGKNKDVEGTQVRWRNLRLQEVANQLSEVEQEQGWQLLWDGQTSQGWRSAKNDAFPKGGWKIADGVLTIHESGGGEASNAGDIVTVERYANFEFKVDFRITPGANSGIKYFCQPNLDPITGTGAKAATGSAIGLEFQILDDARHPDAKAGRAGNRTMASLYDLKAADAAKRPNPIGEWNTAHVIAHGNKVEHRLNGKKVLEFERGSAAFRDLVAQSKYQKIPGFGEWAEGHILLQDHGNTVSFRNLKLRKLPAP